MLFSIFFFNHNIFMGIIVKNFTHQHLFAYLRDISTGIVSIIKIVISNTRQFLQVLLHFGGFVGILYYMRGNASVRCIQ